jgi:hypothetical protein
MVLIANCVFLITIESYQVHLTQISFQLNTTYNWHECGGIFLTRRCVQTLIKGLAHFVLSNKQSHTNKKYGTWFACICSIGKRGSETGGAP